MAVRSIHSLSEEQHQIRWNNSFPPVLTVRENEPVTIHTREGSNHQVKPGDSAEAIRQMDFSRLIPINGPIAIEGARLGDVLQVDILDIETDTWAWSHPQRMRCALSARI